MSTRYLTLLDMLRRTEGVDQCEACAALSVSPSTYRGMVRDFREVFAVHTKMAVTDKRRARHYIRPQDQGSATNGSSTHG